MIICSNCGTTNNESAGNICRTCGALLPRSNRAPRMKIATKTKKILKSQEENTKTKQRPTPAKAQKKQSNKKTPTKSLDLHEIPKVGVEEEINEDYDTQEEDFLKEIAPKPFRGSIIADKNVYGKPVQPKKGTRPKSKKHSQNSETIKDTESHLLRQKQLEEDMTEVLSFLSKKITVKPLESIKKSINVSAKPKDSIPPSSMNEILKDLLKLDLHIEASAIIKKDGTILASALSSRISDSLFATIAANLSMIGNDIIKGLSAGTLQNISIRGSEGVLDLAPISFKNLPGDDMILMIFSHPKLKAGIIHFAVSIVKKRVKQYLGLVK